MGWPSDLIAMDFKRLRYFVQIVDSGSLTRAAAALGIAQPALSQQMAALEAETKAKLLERGATGVTPTGAGRTLYAHAQAILRRVDVMVADVGDDAERVAGKVSIGAPPSLSETLIVPLIVHAAAKHPDLLLDIVEHGGVSDVMLMNGQLDIAISPRRPASPKIATEHLLDEDIFVVAPAGWGLPPSVSLADIAKLPWLMSPPGHPARTAIDAAFVQSGVQPRIVATLDSKRTTLIAVEREAGVALLTHAAAKEGLERGTVTASTLRDAAIARPIFLCWPQSGQGGPGVDFVLNHLRNAPLGPQAARPGSGPA